MRTKSKRWFINDSCGICCVVFTYLLIFFAECVVLFVTLLPESSTSSTVHAIIYNVLIILAVAAHYKTMVTDPGAVPIGNATPEALRNLRDNGSFRDMVVVKCVKCECIKPERAHHCRKMDHHCPWVNNCVGEYNQKYFVLFTMYICLSSIYSIFLGIRHFIICHSIEARNCKPFSLPATIVFVVALLFEGLLFGLFTLIMWSSQMYAIANDETGIEALKSNKDGVQKKAWLMNFKEVFGGSFSLLWFSPFNSVHYRGKEDAMHYIV
ncbi:expressed hypothetical protein [Trichoplax adhaerens]|uniref:Palmitoyltransferase n=1 Tax=Trichoplax adhaerens TaxID=10228 RepID=B3S6U9_TRIAD|nr:expressed hypothetical protein [Trichoplax adhaerens]EDV21684.1 expressed hypothetical protein [Trichoplax adhaerens]|eukprot:XP_002115832.1 expressed hypothetical protein [Trichoplax adhaerens]